MNSTPVIVKGQYAGAYWKSNPGDKMPFTGCSELTQKMRFFMSKEDAESWVTLTFFVG
ncbi:MAG: hypothetical protein PUP93_30455 [Rhizonema sp. NSF051]|nr:hypothetical protein [Rhizonema sp. NSF051]